MSTHTRASTPRQQAHTDATSRQHEIDKAEGERRARITHIPVPTPEMPSPRRNFGQYLSSHAWICEEGEWRRCDDPGEYAEYVVSEAVARKWFHRQTSRHGKSVTVKTKARTPVEILTTVWSPWLSDATLAALLAGRDVTTLLREMRNRWLSAAIARLASHRFILGYSLHTDTSDPHFDLALSRQDGKGGRIGQAGLGLCGPWVTAVDRQVRCGAKISAPKASQLRRSVANFRHRYGPNAVPLDVQLTRDLDDAADAVMGAELQPFKDAYAASVPELERRHIEVQLQALDAAKAKLTHSEISPDFSYYA